LPVAYTCTCNIHWEKSLNRCTWSLYPRKSYPITNAKEDFSPGFYSSKRPTLKGNCIYVSTIPTLIHYGELAQLVRPSSLFVEGVDSITGIVISSDNFSFQNNGIKKCTYWKTMRCFGKQWVFKAMFFYTTSHMIYFDYMHFIKIKNIHVLHKISFHNTIPHRSHSLIGHLIQELWYILLCFALLHSEITSF